MNTLWDYDDDGRPRALTQELPPGVVIRNGRPQLANGERSILLDDDGNEVRPDDGPTYGVDFVSTHPRALPLVASAIAALPGRVLRAVRR